MGDVNMSGGFSKVYLITVEAEIAQTGVDGDFVFELSPFAAKNNILEYFFFVDGAGDQVDASEGTVIVTLSPGKDIFQTVDSGSFNAADARLSTRTKPNGYGKAAQIKITLAGVTGDPVGFVGLLTQSVS